LLLIYFGQITDDDNADDNADDDDDKKFDILAFNKVDDISVLFN